MKHNPKSIVLLSHLGRPNGVKNTKFSLKPIVGELEGYLNRKVTFLDDCVTDSVINTVKNSKSNEIYLCENVRFYIE
jgi:phosphoglycerate kinase